MDNIKEFINLLENSVWTYAGIPLLVLFGLYFTFVLRGLQLTKITLMCKQLFKKDPNNTDGITPFQSFTMAMAARVGVGSLAGIGLAISLGGYGAILWMWIIATIGAASAFVESTLAQLYKERKNGLSFGGASYYIKNGLGLKKLSIGFAILFSIVYGLLFPLVQTDSIVTGVIKSDIIESGTGQSFIISGAIAIILAAIIFGGAKTIAKVTEKVVPVMAIAFFLLGLFLIMTNIGLFGDFFVTVFKDAMEPKAFVSGGVITAVMYGVKRGIFANEAGMGSGPTAAASAEVKYPVESGLTQALSVLITSLVIGTITAFVIFSAQFDLGPNLPFKVDNGIEITIESFKYHFGDFGLWFLVVSVVLFAFSTILTACYYLESSINFITNNKSVQFYAKFIVLFVVILGGAEQSAIAWAVTDFGVALMASINAVVIFILFPKVIQSWLSDKDKLEK